MTNFNIAYKEIIDLAPSYIKKQPFDLIFAKPTNKIIFYGLGTICDFAIHTVSLYIGTIAIDRPHFFFCDRQKKTYKYQTQEFPIIEPRQLLQEHRDAAVLISSWGYENEIFHDLIEAGFPEEQIFFFRYPWRIDRQNFEQKYLAGYSWAYNFFQDDRSKQKILDRVKLLLYGLACPQDSFYADGYFGSPYIDTQAGDIYVDGGAFTGDSVEEFVRRYNDGEGYRQIYAFEPDPQNFQSAQKNVSHYDRVRLIPKGLWSSETSLHFQPDNIASGAPGASAHFIAQSTASSITVPVTSLDTVFADLPPNISPTLIKLDIEGAEKEALLGSSHIIKRNKPRLIICAYHKPEDIYELPQTIMSLRPDYKMALWQIGHSFWDLVLYAF